MFLSRSSELGIRAVLYIALNSDETHKAGIKEISDQLEAPTHFLGKILQQLSRHEILSSTKGPNGGFYMIKSQRKKTLLQVVEVLDGKHVFKKCGLGLKYCSDQRPCPIHHDFAKHRDGIRDMLAARTIEDMTVNIREEELFI